MPGGGKADWPAECMRFEEMTWRERFDGIWACASLLHVSRSELPAVLGNFHRALKTGGVMYASFKYGGGEEERLGRFFKEKPWVNIIVRKKCGED